MDAQVSPYRWYVAQARPGLEKVVAQNLRDRINRSPIQDQFGQVLVPSEEVVEMHAGQKRLSDRKFFPGYILIQIAQAVEEGVLSIPSACWHLVKETDKISGFIGGTKARPLPITEKEADTILGRVEQGQNKPRPAVLFEKGQPVRVVEGPFNDFDGVVETVDYDKAQLRVAVQIFGRSTIVEFAFPQVKAA